MLYLRVCLQRYWWNSIHWLPAVQGNRFFFFDLKNSIFIDSFGVKNDSKTFFISSLTSRKLIRVKLQSGFPLMNVSSRSSYWRNSEKLLKKFLAPLTISLLGSGWRGFFTFGHFLSRNSPNVKKPLRPDPKGKRPEGLKISILIS